MIQRQTFLKVASLGTLASTLPLMANENASQKVCIFTKPFQHLSYEQLAEVMVELGSPGLELPLRPKGHIEPEKAADELPKMVEVLKKHNLSITIAATGINSVDSPHAESTLKVAKSMGIQHYRMGYHKYDLKKNIPAQLANIKAMMKDLTDMNKDIGIQGLYQNHSGDRYFGAPLWDLYEVLKDLNPKFMASAIDLGHTTVEGGKSWPIQLQLLKPHIQSIYVKDPIWENKKTVWKPLGEGQVSPKMIKTLKDFRVPGPVSLHVEYMSHKDHGNFEKFKAAFKRDLKTLKSWF